MAWDFAAVLATAFGPHGYRVPTRIVAAGESLIHYGIVPRASTTSAESAQ